MTALPKGHTAVMSRRVEPPDSLDFFPTPPWATRALCEVVLGRPSGLDVRPDKTVWEPACGEGHMSEVLKDYFRAVYASDVHDYGKGYPVGTFVGEGPDRWYPDHQQLVDWVITNPPFNLASDFLDRALDVTRHGVALLLRSNWAEGGERYRHIFEHRRPSIEALFVERVPMMKGRWEPDGSTATSYTWFVWQKPLKNRTIKDWIPPGQRQRLTRPDDRRRFAAPAEPMTLFPDAAE